MERNQNEKPGNMNNWTELTKMMWLSDRMSETRMHGNKCAQIRWKAGRAVGGRAESSESSLEPRTASPTYTIHCICRVSQLLFVCLRTPKLTSPPTRARTFHTHIAENSTTFSLTSWTLPLLRRQNSGCHREGPASVPGHTVRVLRWTE
jgi:hypothetical protein